MSSFTYHHQLQVVNPQSNNNVNNKLEQRNQLQYLNNLELIFPQDDNKRINTKQNPHSKIKQQSLQLQIQLDDGEIQFIVPKIGDNPYKLAFNFCQKHSLDNGMIQILTQNIKETIRKLKQGKVNIKNINKRVHTEQSVQRQQSISKRNLNQQKNPNILPLNIKTQQKQHSSTNFHSSTKFFNQQKKKHDLYQRCLRQQNSKKNWIQRQKHLKSTTQLIQCTHSPSINQISQTICMKKSLYQSKSHSRKRQDQYSSIRTQQSQTSNHKQISKFQLKQKNNRFKTQNDISVFDYLYEEGKIKQIKKKNNIESFLKRNCNFQPKINQTSRQIVGNKSFQQRMNSYRRNINGQQKYSKSKSKSRQILKQKQKLNESENKKQKHFEAFNLIKHSIVKYSAVRKQNSEDRKYQSHVNKSFNSKQNNNSSSNRPSSNKPSSNRLSSKVNSKPIVHILSSSSSKNMNQHQSKTQKIYFTKKQKSFQNIFCLLDDNNDGLISILNINLLNGIQQKLIKILFPVLQQLQILQTQLNLKEFTQAMDNLFLKLSLQSKGYLLKYSQKIETKMNKQNHIPIRKPRMTAVSTQLVNQTQRANVTVYEYSKIRDSLKEQKLQLQRIEKQKILMRNCTFYPKINSKKIFYF